MGSNEVIRAFADPKLIYSVDFTKPIIGNPPVAESFRFHTVNPHHFGLVAPGNSMADAAVGEFLIDSSYDRIAANGGLLMRLHRPAPDQGIMSEGVFVDVAHGTNGYRLDSLEAFKLVAEMSSPVVKFASGENWAIGLEFKSGGVYADTTEEYRFTITLYGAFSEDNVRSVIIHSRQADINLHDADDTVLNSSIMEYLFESDAPTFTLEFLFDQVSGWGQAAVRIPTIDPDLGVATTIFKRFAPKAIVHPPGGVDGKHPKIFPPALITVGPAISIDMGVGPLSVVVRQFSIFDATNSSEVLILRDLVGAA